MRAVARVALARPGNQARVLHEIVAVNVVLIAVAVGVFAGIEHLAVVLPHIGLQVGVGVHHTLVEHGDDDRRIARAHLPRLHAIDVATGDDLRVRIVLLERIVARIVVMPLVFQRGIGFERQSQPRKVDVILGSARRGEALCGGVAHVGFQPLGVVGALDPVVALHGGDFSQQAQLAGSFMQIGILVEFHLVPQMEPRFAGPRLVPLVAREDTLEMITAENIQNLIGRRNARTGHHTAAAVTGSPSERPVQNIRHLGFEFDQQLPRFGVGRELHFRPGGRSRGSLLQILLDARRQRKGEERRIYIISLHQIHWLFIVLYCWSGHVPPSSPPPTYLL